MGSCLSHNPPNINEDEAPEPDVRTEEQKQQEQQNTAEPVSMTNVATGRARFSGYVVEDNKKTPISSSEGMLKKAENGEVYVSLPINSKGWDFTIRPCGNLVGTHNLHAIVILKDGTELSCDAEVDIADMDALRIIEDVTFELISETSPKNRKDRADDDEDDEPQSDDEGENSDDKDKSTQCLEIQGSISWKIDEDELEGSQNTQSNDKGIGDNIKDEDICDELADSSEEGSDEGDEDDD